MVRTVFQGLVSVFIILNVKKGASPISRYIRSVTNVNSPIPEKNVSFYEGSSA